MGRNEIELRAVLSGRISRHVCLLVVIGAINLHCEERRRFTVADDIEMSHFGDPYTGAVKPITFSPDGRYFAVTTERGRIDLNKPESTLRVYRLEDVRRFLKGPETTRGPSPILAVSRSTYDNGPIITDVRWVPNSSGVAFLAKTASGNDQLFFADLTSKTVVPLTPQDQHVKSFDIRNRNHYVYSVLSPVVREKVVIDSHATTLVGTGRDFYHLVFPEAKYPFTSMWHDLGNLWAVVDGKRFRVKDKSSGRLVTLYSEGETALALSPDGRWAVTARAVGNVPTEWETVYPPPYPSFPYRIRATAQDLSHVDGHRYVSEYVLIDLVRGLIKPLTGAPTGPSAGWGQYLRGRWSDDGQSILLPATFFPPEARDTNGQPNRPCIAAIDLVKNRLECLEAWKGPTKDGYEDGFHALDDLDFARGNRKQVTLTYTRLDGSQGTTIYVESNGGSWTSKAESGELAHTGGSVDVSIKQSTNDPPVLVATDRANKISRVIWDPNPQLRGIELGEASDLRWRDTNGRNWVGTLFKPPDYVPGQRYPLVIQTHALFWGQFIPSGTFPSAFAARELAAAGMMVLQTTECPYTMTPNEGPCNVAEYEAAVEQMEKDGMVNPTRVGIIGFSRTCFYVLEALTTSTLRFRAASITDGIDNGYVQYVIDTGTGNGGALEAEAMNGGRPFGGGLQEWLKRSPGFNMEKVTAPVQVVALGPMNLPSMWEPYALLSALNKPVDLIMMTQQGTHVLSNPAQRMASQGGTVDWMSFWLLDHEDADPGKAEQYARWRELRKLQQENEAKQKTTAPAK